MKDDFYYLSRIERARQSDDPLEKVKRNGADDPLPCSRVAAGEERSRTVDRVVPFVRHKRAILRIMLVEICLSAYLLFEAVNEQERVENNEEVVAVPEDLEKRAPDRLRRGRDDDDQRDGDENARPAAEKNKDGDDQVDVRVSNWVEVRIF